jgi:hypothetical protein
VEKAVKSDQQCDVGLHVFKVGIRPEFVGLISSSNETLNLKCLEVEVDRDDILFGGTPGNDMKIRVKKLTVLKEVTENLTF